MDSFHRGNQETGDILDLDEVPSLLPIAVHIERRVLVKRRREFRDHPGVSRCWVVTRTVDVEESQSDGWHAMHLYRGAGVQFASPLIGTVGRDRPRFVRLTERQSRIVAVHGSGRRVDHWDWLPGRNGMRGLKNIDRAAEIDSTGMASLNVAAIDRWDCSEMETALYASHCRRDGAFIIDTSDDHLRVRPNIGPPSRGHIVEDANIMTSILQHLDEMRADKAASAGD